MPTESEIKSVMTLFIKEKYDKAETGDDFYPRIESEIDDLASKEDPWGKSVLQKIYSQWQSGKQGHKNPFNSLLAWALGITTKAPDGEFVLPRRRAFARPSPPDIDSDFDYENRQIIVDYLVAKYGRGRVGNIGTYGALKMKSALTRIIKALDIAGAFHLGPDGKPMMDNYTSQNVKKVTEILGTLPKQYGAVLTVQDHEGNDIVLKSTKDVMKANSDACNDFRFYMQKHPEIYEHALNIEGLLSIFSVHASGIVLSDIPLENIAPLRIAKDYGGSTFSLATQFANEDLELLGLIKFDILGLSTLTVIAETVKMIKDNYGIQLDIENLPLDDKPTFDLYKTGKLCGVFQCESPGMQKTCMEVGVDRFDDIMAVISLYRPGPMESIPEYCDRKAGRRRISYFHPSIEPFVKDILSSTYGVLVYQEQVMKICEKLGGMTPSEGLVVIKGIGKKKADVIEKGRKGFINGAVANGVPRDIAEQYWDKFITPFALYGFNAAHSCCYAYNSYITAYLKANYPEEFMCAYMNVETSRRKLERVDELEAECQKNMGIRILPRELNKCGLKYEIVRRADKGLGISSEIRPAIHCKGLPTLAAENIVANRPYSSIKEFAEKTDISVVDAESVQALCDAKFFKTKASKLLEEFTIIRDDLKNSRKKGREIRDIFDE